MTASQFVCATLGIPPQPPSRAAPVTSDTCWLCGGPLDEHAWPLPLAMKQTSVNPPDAVAPYSDGCCWQCMALTMNETWGAYVDHHPDVEHFKRGKLIGWRNSSHLIATGTHETPMKPAWRDLLLSPPDPPFVAVVAVSTQKQLIFRSTVAHSRDVFPIQFEDDRVLVDRFRLAECMETVEGLYAMGLSKASIETGAYQVQALMKVPRPVFLALEEEMKRWRAMQPDLVRVAVMIARKEEVDAVGL